MTQVIDKLTKVSHQYRALFVDLWGCLHDGIRSFPTAVSALETYRSTGGIVIIVTNSPRTRVDVEKQLQHFGVSEYAWDSIATSGDSARLALFQGTVGQKVWTIGYPGDDEFFRPVNILRDPIAIQQVSLEQAQGIVCTGPFDPQAPPTVMKPEFNFAVRRGLKLLCANPDIVVDRGDRREWCAGALARLYTEMGGTSLYFGKPHPPIYDLARRRLAKIVDDIADSDILVIGDGITTDISGAVNERLDSLFVSGGLARAETKTVDQPNAQALAKFLERQKIHPTYTIGMLR
ncbi:MAG: TIGR01459 family HAD-type hydrolase [Aestuariivita sp.]|nr:TIGR01459 family HAD-type hydrolase [Aestuariivita sp.]MCY4203677.1 TIGR01459 family HAD-type hydrolase [Aestuariivita sp.]MCY4287009.1 TIGR01459 family HAD-type hydrolase [Aestuariivita sp.]MCY4347656.1 TIGR01459 family HAD-type hydrolase [Aestuariivita sp.]